MRSGACFERPMQALHTDESGSSSSRWPTPSASVFNDAEDPAAWLARAELLKEKHANGNGAGMPLAVAAKLSTWPTPSASDHKGSYAPEQRRGQLTDAVQDHGALNPAWVEQLMGFPAGWTGTDGPPVAVKRNTSGSRRASRKVPRTDDSG